MKLTRTIPAALASAAALALAFPTGAGAATPPPCTGCQTLQSATGLKLAIGQGFRSPVLGLSRPGHGLPFGQVTNDEFTLAAVAGHTVIQWTPAGFASGEYVGDVNGAAALESGIVASDEWDITGGLVVNVATGRALQTPGDGQAAVTVKLPVSGGSVTFTVVSS